MHSHITSISQAQAHAHKLRSPFRYPGGKFYARKQILQEIPRHEYYCEPFAGGASIYFAKPLALKSILNDLDSEVINTFAIIRDYVEPLISLLMSIPISKKTHSYLKKNYKPQNNLQRAFRWYFLNRISYSGIMKYENCYWGYGTKYSMKHENWGEHLRKTSHKLQNTKLISDDFESVIDSAPDNCFLFIDPPYYATDQHKFYIPQFKQADHERLADCLRRNAKRISFLLTYDDHSAVQEMYDGWTNQCRHQWNYTISRSDDQRNKLNLKNGYKGSRNLGEELFIKNYELRSF
ncbi:MAG: DNA adenine methylase [Candidatus Saccharibacteria bacterium]|nr:DNA adenine methylase [Candidatus Saccharibacteria bacterium]